MNLDATVADGAAGIAGIHLGNGNGSGRVGRVFSQRPSGIVDRRAGALGFQIHVRALMLHRLEHSDGFAELFPSLGVFDRNVQGPLHAADQFGSQSGGSDVESPWEIRGGADFFRRSVAEFHDV